MPLSNADKVQYAPFIGALLPLLKKMELEEYERLLFTRGEQADELRGSIKTLKGLQQIAHVNGKTTRLEMNHVKKNDEEGENNARSGHASHGATAQPRPGRALFRKLPARTPDPGDSR